VFIPGIASRRLRPEGVEQSFGNAGRRAGHEAVVFNGRMWVIGGARSSTLFNDVWSSADGVNWILEKEHAEFKERFTHTVVALNNARPAMPGSSGH